MKQIFPLSLPGTPDLDDPNTTLQRRQLIFNKPFLRLIYEEWYRSLAGSIPQAAGPVLEIGSGPGFLERFVPGLITSEIFYLPGIGCVQDAQSLGLASQSLKAILMVDVFHHIPDARAFLSEASRCLRPGGVLAMIEPWNTPWSAFVYCNFHHEAFEPRAARWEFESSGPLSGANGALPWIIFKRDVGQFQKEYPSLQIEKLRPIMPFRYLVSGGLSRPSFAPAFSFRMLSRCEGWLRPWFDVLAMFCLVVVKKK
jgi:SAM-dependent methyltransferase